MYVPDEYVTACIEEAGPSPVLAFVTAALDLYRAGFGSKSRAAFDAWHRMGSAMVAMNGAPLAFHGGLTRDGQPWPGRPEDAPPEVPDILRRLELALLAAGLAEAPEGREDPPQSSLLLCDDGPVTISLETEDGRIEIVGRTRTIADAETYLGMSAGIDPDALHAGRYGIDAPHGCGSDAEACEHARARGFHVWMSMGGAYWGPPGVAIMGNVNGIGWHGGSLTTDEAALRALASVDPD